MGRLVLKNSYKPPAWTERALHADQCVGPTIRRDELQRAVHQHDVEKPLKVEIEQILPDGLDRQRPFPCEPAAELQRSFTNVQDGDVDAVIGPGASGEGQQAGILRAGDEHIATPAGKEIAQLCCQPRRLIGDADGCPRQAYVGPKRMQSQAPHWPADNS